MKKCQVTSLMELLHLSPHTWPYSWLLLFLLHNLQFYPIIPLMQSVQWFNITYGRRSELLDFAFIFLLVWLPPDSQPSFLLFSWVPLLPPSPALVSLTSLKLSHFPTPLPFAPLFLFPFLLFFCFIQVVLFFRAYIKCDFFIDCSNSWLWLFNCTHISDYQHQSFSNVLHVPGFATSFFHMPETSSPNQIANSLRSRSIFYILLYRICKSSTMQIIVIIVA